MSKDIKLHRKLKGYNPICGKVKGVQPHIYVLSIKAYNKTGLGLWQSEDKTMWGQTIFPGSPPFKSHVYICCIIYLFCIIPSFLHRVS